jgi:hypothetical protein
VVVGVDKIEDNRVGCMSVMTSMRVGEFLEIVAPSYDDKGGLEGQRPALKTKTALTIRERLVEDLKKGAVVPPVVIGILCLDPKILHSIEQSKTSEQMLKHVSELPKDSISIIDGMQRTTAFLEAGNDLPSFFHDSVQRFEFWISDSLSSLVYRMLVLNTGQVPWEISRQLETIYSQFLQKLRAELGDHIEIFKRDDERRRRDAGQYQASIIIRLFLSFASRRMEFDLKDRIAEDFARIDTIEATSHDQFFSSFVQSLELLAALDEQFSRASSSGLDSSVRIQEGRAVFQSYPALVGFTTAVAVEIMDEAGFDVNWHEVEGKLESAEQALAGLFRRLGDMEPDQVREFLDLPLLNERLAVRSGQVGRFERDFFFKAFQKMIRNAHRLESMQPCWLA